MSGADGAAHGTVSTRTGRFLHAHGTVSKTVPCAQTLESKGFGPRAVAQVPCLKARARPDPRGPSLRGILCYVKKQASTRANRVCTFGCIDPCAGARRGAGLVPSPGRTPATEMHNRSRARALSARYTAFPLPGTAGRAFTVAGVSPAYRTRGLHRADSVPWAVGSSRAHRHQASRARRPGGRSRSRGPSAPAFVPASGRAALDAPGTTPKDAP